MNEFVIFLIKTFSLDVDLLALFSSVGAEISVTSTSSQTEEDFPCIYVYDKDSRNPYPTGDSVYTQCTGDVRIKIETKRSDSCPEPAKLMWAFQQRIAAILFGDRKQKIPSLVIGQSIGEWVVSGCREVSPTGTVPDPDPLVKCHLLTIKVCLSRQ